MVCKDGTTIVMSAITGRGLRGWLILSFMDKGKLMEQTSAKQFFCAPSSDAGKTYLKFA